MPRLEQLESRRLLAADLQNPYQRFDVNHDSKVTPLDALAVINLLNRSEVNQQNLRAGFLSRRKWQ
ncbi:dockerin type I domain-containing protein [Planctomycetaceae bacterium SH139]